MTAILKTSLGQKAEELACDFLLAQGLKLIIKNYRGPRGEIDLIMQEGNEIIFVEVRSRQNIFFGMPIETINSQKQQKIIQTALNYLQKHRLLNKTNCRFDVISVIKNQCEWIKNAFSSS